MNKKGSHVDWAISIGIFLVYLIGLFILLRPGVTPVHKPEGLLNILEDRFNEEVMWEVREIPLFIDICKLETTSGGDLACEISVEDENEQFTISNIVCEEGDCLNTENIQGNSIVCEGTNEKPNLGEDSSFRLTYHLEDDADKDATPDLVIGYSNSDPDYCKANFGASTSKFGINREWLKKLKPNEIRLLRAKNYRLLFDFENAKKILTDIRSKLTDRREEIEDAENDLERLKNRDIKALIKELYENMEIKWKQGAYVDFLGRLFRFEEACYYYLISKNFGIDISNRQNHKEFIDIIKKDNELMRFLKSKRYGGNELKIDETNVKRPLLFFILSYHKEKWGVGLLYRVFNKINDYEGNPDLSLGNLRNKTIIAHGFEGVSKEKIMELYKGDILDDLHDVCRMISKF